MNRIINNKIFILPACFATVVILGACSSGREITTATPQEIIQAVTNDQWKFIATYVTPAYGSSRSLTSEYSVTTNNKKLVVALPYYGKLNSPAGALSGNPLDFASTSFNISKEPRSNGGWWVNIKNPDPEVQSMSFTFFDNGSAQLSITMTNRTGISYTGRVMPV
ncbi:MAG TPA: DUF4251 domain-containing protein [Chitinophagaceae bacterium]|nr:DUF4251 domain-containing protein [Chitinophagaceae bacterium]